MTPECFPRDQYYCLLDEQPDYLVPPRLLRSRVASGTLMINPYCWFAWQVSPPANMISQVGDLVGLFNTPWIVWVVDPATFALTPFWIGPELAHLLVDLVPGQFFTRALRPDLLAILWNAQILVTQDYAVQRRLEWIKLVQWYSRLASRGYVALDKLVHPFHLGAMRRYFRYRTRTNTYELGDAQTPRRFVAHCEPVANFLHRQLTRAISDIVGRSLKPSYTYVTLYQDGADLPPHTDREQCEYTFSFCFDSTPEPTMEVNWPLQLRSQEGVICIWQHLGDGLLFRGRSITHWRDRLPSDSTASSILFHFVNHNFSGAVL